MDYKNLTRSTEAIEKAINYVFKDRTLLVSAFIHRSFLNEHHEVKESHNERLEFLGDAVFNLLISKHLFLKLEEEPEGELSKIRANIVSRPSCCVFLKHLGIENFLLVGKGETSSRGMNSMHANLFEAIIGAIYIDGGIEAAHNFLFSHFSTLFDSMIEMPKQNYKASFQEHLQKSVGMIPEYRVLEETGPHHEKKFVIGVFVKNELQGKGAGFSKKEAEQLAAKQALFKLFPNLK